MLAAKMERQRAASREDRGAGRSRSLLNLPARAVLRVFQRDAELAEFGAQAIGFRPVLCAPSRRQPFGDQALRSGRARPDPSPGICQPSRSRRGPDPTARRRRAIARLLPSCLGPPAPVGADARCACGVLRSSASASSKRGGYFSRAGCRAAETSANRSRPARFLAGRERSSRSADDNASAASPCATSAPGQARPPNLSLASNSRIVTKLPRLFDIFSPSTCRKPLCIQTFAMRWEPKAQQDWAISFS